MPDFDYTAAIRRTCADICFRVSELRHIDTSRVAFSFSQTKHSDPYGVFASTYPLRFEGGELTVMRRGRRWMMQRFYKADLTEYLYILYFYVPRFIDLSLTDKLETIVHELYHISPFFNGDLRRFKGRCFAHGSSQKKYDATVRTMTQKWLAGDPSPDVWDFLRYDFNQLRGVYGVIQGTRIPMPKIVPYHDTPPQQAVSAEH